MQLDFASSLFSQRKFSAALVHILPFFLAPLVMGIPPRGEFFFAYVKTYLFFLLLFTAWKLLRLLVLHEQRETRIRITRAKEKKASPEKKSFKHTALLILFSLFLLAALKPFKDAFGDELFYFSLVLMGSAALSDSLALREKFRGALIARFIYLSGAGFLSFQPAIPSTLLHPIIFSVGLGAILSSEFGIRALQTVASTSYHGQATQGRDFRRLVRLATLLFIAGPLCPAILVYVRQIPQSYLLPLLILPLVFPAISALQRNEKTLLITPNLFYELRLAALLYVVILAALGLLY